MTATSNHSENNSSTLRNELSSIGRNSSVYLIGLALSRAVGFFMLPIYTRLISPTNYGVMELIEIVAAGIVILISLNVVDVMPRFYYAENEEKNRKRVISTIIIGFSLLGVPIVIVLVGFSNYLSLLIFDSVQYKLYLGIITITVWFGMLCEIGYTYLRMLYLAKTFVLIIVIQLFLALFLNIYFVVFKEMDILGIFLSTLITQSLTGVILLIWILNRVRFSFSVSLLRSLVVFGLPLVPYRMGLMLGFVSNRFFLRWFSSPDPAIALAHIGLFSLGHKFGVLVNRFINAPFNSYWGPRRLELLLAEKLENKETIARVCTYSSLCSIYFTLILSAGIENLIEIMAGTSYKGAHNIVPFVALSYVALGFETHFMTGMVYRRKSIWATYIGIISLAVVLLWNYIFIPKYGLMGAATSNLVGITIKIIFTYIISQRMYSIPFEIRRIVTMLIVAFLLFLASQTIEFSSPYLTFFARTSIVSTFPLILLLIRFYSRGELDGIFLIIKRGRQMAETVFQRI